MESDFFICGKQFLGEKYEFFTRLRHRHGNVCKNERGALQYLGKVYADGWSVSLDVRGAFEGEDVWISKDFR